MKIIIETIPHNLQQYTTVGNWTWEDEYLKIEVSESGNDDWNFLIGIHEAIEAWLCKKAPMAWPHGIHRGAVSAVGATWLRPFCLAR